MRRGAIICLSLVAVLLWTCKPDFIEIDLNKATVTLNTPTNNLQTTTLTQTFWWDRVEGATWYEIQVVSPTLASPAVLLLDSTTASNQYTLTLTPGNYEWQVRAFNNSSSTDFTFSGFTIDSTPDISSQIIVLTAPVNNLITNDSTITFKWDTLYNADDYRFEIAIPDFNNGTEELAPQAVEIGSITHSFKQEGVFQWRVRGQNAFSNTPYTTFTIEIDTTRPNVPLLVNPAYNEILPDSINPTLFWDRGTVTGSTIMDSLYIYADSSLTNLVRGVFTANTSYSDSLGLGDFYWRVISIDAASNRSGYSPLRKFTIQ